MATRMPPIPAGNRTPHRGEPSREQAEEAKVTGHDKHDRNLKEQGHQGNITQNTRNQGYQQDR